MSNTEKRPQPDRPAGTLVVVGTMGLIAAVTVSAVIGLARISAAGGEGDPEGAQSDPVPTTLADEGAVAEVPEAVATSVGGAVVGARMLDAPSEALADCDRDMAGEVDWRTGPDLETGVVTPDAVYASFVGQATGGFGMEPMPIEPAPRQERVQSGIASVPEPTSVEPVEGVLWRVECMTQEPGTGLSGSSGPVENTGSGSFSSCCDRAGRQVSLARVAAPAEAAWALQDRGGWWLAYPVRDGQVLVTWTSPGPEPQGSTWVQFVDADGAVLEEASVDP